MRLWGLLLAWLVVANTQSHAAIQTLAITGDAVTAIPGEQFSIGEGVFPLARLSNNGSVAFSAMLNHSSPNVTSDNDYVLFRFAEDETQVIAREGIGGVPNAPGASYATISNFGIDNDGSIFARGTLVINVGGVTDSSNQGAWKFTESEASEIARTGSSQVPGFPGSNYDFISFILQHSSNGIHVHDARMESQGSVNANNNFGIWQNINGVGSLIVREGQNAPEIDAPFDTFGSPATSNNGEVAFRSVVKQGFSINSTNRLGLFYYNSDGGTLLARTGSGGVPGLPGSNFTAFEDPKLNSSGQLMLNATIDSVNVGLWRYDGSSGELLAVEGGEAPDVDDATFIDLNGPGLSDNGQVIARGELNLGSGVNSSNQFGLWAFDEVKGHRMLARAGTLGMVPEKPESTFANFPRYATNALGDVLVHGELNESFDDLAHQGIWLYPYEGEPQLLIESGDTLAGLTIESLEFLHHEWEVGFTSGVLNNSGQFVFQAGFTNGDFGLFLYSPDANTPYAPADFNTDGYVDSSDLAIWAGAFGETVAGDADDDGDTDGRDFLIWQRQFSGPPAQTALAVPEPAVWWCLGLFFGFAQHRSTFAAIRYV